MKIISIHNAAESMTGTSVEFSEVLRFPAMSAGVYHLPRRADDPQDPHMDDEVYYVLSGRGKLESGGETAEIGPGDLIHVPAHEPHKFVEIEQALTLLVVFAPAERGG
ncbi:MAG TPA: cupin domain-containing protein [Anaerolineales bacterium]|nr:cupin domain-containing protein [Anaerolineales bacterium]